MSRFKPGDRVRMTYGEHGQVAVGAEGTVESGWSTGSYVVWDTLKPTAWHSPGTPMAMQDQWLAPPRHSSLPSVLNPKRKLAL